MAGFEILQVIDDGDSLGFDSSEKIILDWVRTLNWSVSGYPHERKNRLPALILVTKGDLDGALESMGIPIV